MTCFEVNSYGQIIVIPCLLDKSIVIFLSILLLRSWKLFAFLCQLDFYETSVNLTTWLLLPSPFEKCYWQPLGHCYYDNPHDHCYYKYTFLYMTNITTFHVDMSWNMKTVKGLSEAVNRTTDDTMDKIKIERTNTDLWNTTQKTEPNMTRK